MFCSSCRKIDSDFEDIKRKVCDAGHIFCKLCDKITKNCIICDQPVLNFIHVEVNTNIPRICYSSITEAVSDQEVKIVPLEANGCIDSDDSDRSFMEIIKELNEYENCCNKAECEVKPIVGCVQVIGHRADDVSCSITLDDDDEREILRNFCGKTVNDQDEKPNKSDTTKSHSKKNFHANKNSVKSSKSITCGDRYNSSLIVNKSSTREVISESRHSCLSFTTRSECFCDDDPSLTPNSNLASAYQLFKKEDTINESETANFTSLSASRLEASPPEVKNDSKIPSNACRAKFAPIFQCDHNFSSQTEPIEYFEPDTNEETKNLLENLALSLPRMPITCPCSFCGMVTTPSDLFTHITVDHPNIETVKLAPHKVVNCSFCPSGNVNYARCHRMFLLSGKLTDIGYGPFKNCLPILLLSCKFNLREIFGSSTLQNQQYQKSEEILCIWLTSVYQYPVNYSLNIWKQGKDQSERSFIKCVSTASSCLNIKQTNREIVTSVLSLTHAEYADVCDDENIIQCQVVFN